MADQKTHSSWNEQKKSKVKKSFDNPFTAGSYTPDPDDTPGQIVLKFISRNIIVIISAIVFLITITMTNSALADRKESLQTQEAEILQLEQNVSSRQEEESTAYNDAIASGTGGIDIKHKESDDKKMEELMKTALSWKGTSGYLNARSTIKDKYGFAEDSQFLSEFMPGEMQGAIRKDASGETHSAVDSNIASEFAGMNTMVTEINADVYSYVATATMRQLSDSGTASSDAVIYLRYRMVDGNPTNVEIYTNPAGVNRSG